MGRHVIIGKGNLGLDLANTARSCGNEVYIFTPSENFKLPDSISEIKDLKPDYIWVTAGFGSVEQCKKEPNGAFDAHVGLPITIVRNFGGDVKIGLFSTDYAADENGMDNPNKINPKPKSVYAITKMCMESCVKMMNRPNVTVFRVASLYGSHFPERTFPGKLLAKFKEPCEVALPQNFITPTPTSWIAEIIMSSLSLVFSPVGPMFHNCAATGGTTVMNFGRKILGDAFTYNSKGMDWERPAYSNMGCSFTQAPNWEQLWEANRCSFLKSLPSPVDAVSDSPEPSLPLPPQSPV